MKRSVVVVLMSLATCAGSGVLRASHRVGEAELGALSKALGAAPGRTIADVGAGDGAVAVPLARRIGPEGLLLATELAAAQRAALSDRVSAEGLQNVTVLTATDESAGLPVECCDAVLMRGVYHHLTRPESTLANIVRALKPGGHLVVVDFPPSALLAAFGSSQIRNGHGVDRQVVLSEVRLAGLEAVSSIEPYPGLWPLNAYGLVFRKVAP